MEDFKDFDGNKIQNVAEYILEYIKENPNVEINIGTDSFNRKDKTIYSTVICFNHLGNGVHIIYNRIKLDKITDLYSRLWKEIEYTKLIADEVAIILNKHDLVLHCDINSNIKFNSNILYNASKGYLSADGYKVEMKPNAWAASYAADYIVKK